MSVVLWPPTLPQEFSLGFTRDTYTSTAIFENDQGPPQALLLSTRERKLFSTTMDLSGAQLATFEEFWEAINFGIDEFQWVDPVDGTASYFIFQRKNGRVVKPQPRQIVGGSKTVPGKTTYQLRRYSLLLELERVGSAPTE